MRYSMGLNDQSTFKDRLKLAIPISLLFVSFVCPLHSAAAQDSDLEKSVYKNNTDSKPSTPAKKKTNSKATVKKTEVKVTTAAKSTKSGSRASTSTKRSTRNSAATADMIDFTFKTPGPNQEVWLGEMKLGVSNDDAVLVKSIKPGVYLVTLKEKAGDVLIKSQLVNVTAERPSIDLKSKGDLSSGEVPTETNANENPDNNVEASEKILAILAKYADPKAPSKVSTEDWNYVLNLAQTNQIKGFTQVQIEAQKWFASGQIELSKGNFADALTAFQSSKTFMAGSAYPDYAIGETYLANNQINDALRFYTSAIAIQPQFALAHGKMGDIFVTLNKPKEAASSYTSALQYGLDTSALRLALAKEQMKNKKWEDASTQLEKVAKDAPSADVFVTLGDLYREQKRIISVYEAYLRATELAPDSPFAFYKLGEVLFEEKEYVRARAAFAKAIELDKEGSNINVSQARKYLRESEQKLK